VGEWIKRAQLYINLNEIDLAAAALEEALKSVSSRKAVNGSPSTIVLTLIDIHENQQKNIEAARGVLDRICSKNEYDFQDSEDLAQCHAAWVELELRQENWDMALNLARRAVSGSVGGKKGSKAVRGLSRSLRLWNLLFDLEESLGTIQTTKDAYDRALEWKVATPSHILNYASFLKDKKYFEESFTAYERGLGLFPFPHPGATLLWKNYLTEFLDRYEGSKTPRVRELFDRCLADCPPEASPEFYIMYGEYEEKHGLTKRALSVYERMCNAVPDAEKFAAFRLYIAKAIQYIGITSARPIYERAISALEDGPAACICLEYAKMETGLREIDRARTVLLYGAQLADPRRDPDYWNAWHEFEVSHGNEETFREMLRVKRSVQAAFSTVNYNAAEMGSGAPKVETLTEDSALQMIAESEGVEVEKKPIVGGFVQAKRTAQKADLNEIEKRAAKLRQVTAASTSADGEIDIDDDEVEDEQPPTKRSNTASNPTEKSIPAAVFGGITATGNNDS
jgi:pre-mRNA-splicing factor SYF1